MIILWVLFGVFFVLSIVFAVLWATGEPATPKECKCLPTVPAEGRSSFYDTPYTFDNQYTYALLPDYKIEFHPSISGNPVEVDDRVSEHHVATLGDSIKKVLRVTGFQESLGMENPVDEDNKFEIGSEFTIEVYLAISTAKTPDLRTRVTPIKEFRVYERTPDELGHSFRNHPWAGGLNDELTVDGRLWALESDFDTEIKVYRVLRIKSTSKTQGARPFTPRGFTGTIQLGERFIE